MQSNHQILFLPDRTVARMLQCNSDASACTEFIVAKRCVLEQKLL